MSHLAIFSEDPPIDSSHNVEIFDDYMGIVQFELFSLTELELIIKEPQVVDLAERMQVLSHIGHLIVMLIFVHRVI